MAITRGATTSSFSTSAVSAVADISHTVDSGTTLLVITACYEADENITATPSWSQGGGENFTLVHATTASGSASNTRNYVYALVNPTSGAGTVSIANDAAARTIFSSAVNYLGTNTVSVAAATNFLSEDVNDAGTNTCVHASAGSAGSALFFCGSLKTGAGGGLSSNDAAFNELFEGRTGTSGSSDQTYYIADLLDSAPSAITVTFPTTASNAGNYIEIIAASAAEPVFDVGGGVEFTLPLATLSAGGSTDIDNTQGSGSRTFSMQLTRRNFGKSRKRGGFR